MKAAWFAGERRSHRLGEGSKMKAAPRQRHRKRDATMAPQRMKLPPGATLVDDGTPPMRLPPGAVLVDPFEEFQKPIGPHVPKGYTLVTRKPGPPPGYILDRPNHGPPPGYTLDSPAQDPWAVVSVTPNKVHKPTAVDPFAEFQKPAGSDEYEVRPPVADSGEYEVHPPGWFPPPADGATPGYFKRLWTAVNTPIASHSDTYNAESDRMDRAQDFSATQAGRDRYAKHPYLTQATAFASQMLQGIDDLLTPAFVATSLAPGVATQAERLIPAAARTISAAGKVARVATTGTYAAAGTHQLYNAATDDTLTHTQRVQEALGGAAALTGVAAEVAGGVRARVTPGALKRAAQETFGAGEEFQRNAAERYAQDAERTRVTNAKREQLNAARQQQHEAAVKKVAQKNADAVHGYGEKSAAHTASVEQAATDHASDLAATDAANQEKLAAHGDAVADNEAAIAQAGDTERIRQQTTDEHDQLSGEHVASVAQAETAATKANDTLWANLRGKIGNATANISKLKGIVKAAAKSAAPVGPSSGGSQLFKSILGEGAEFDDAGRPVVDGETRTVTGEDGKEMLPGHGQYDETYEDWYGEPPPLGGEGGAATFGRLQRWYSYISDKMYGRGQVDGDTYNALKRVRTGINDAMQQVAKETGTEDELGAARESHTQLKETFSDSPNEAATNASKSTKETTGKYVEEQARKKRLQMLGRYDESIPPRAERIRSLQSTLEGLPSQFQTAATNRPNPEAPTLRPAPEASALPAKPTMAKLADLPEPKPAVAAKPEPQAPDLREATRDELTKGLKRYGRIGSVMLRVLVGGTAVHLAHGDIGAMAGEMAVGQAAVTVFTKALRSGRVLDWMSRPTADTLKAIDSVPPADAAKLREALTGLAVEDAKTGGATINAQVAAFLGKDNLARITAAVAAGIPKTAEEARRRVAEVRAGTSGAAPPQ